MGMRDFFRRDDEEWEDPPGDGPDEPGTFIDADGQKRVMPEAMRRSLERAMGIDRDRRRERESEGEGDDGNF